MNVSPTAEVVFETNGEVPANPEDLYRLNRLCLRIYGLLARDVNEQAKRMTDEAAGGMKKKQREILLNTLEEELPVLIALYALEQLALDARLEGQGIDELLRGLLLPCFSLSYHHLYDATADPLKHVLARVDWYIDGDKGDPLDAFVNYISTVLGETIQDVNRMSTKLREVLLPEIKSRLELAFRYEMHN